MNIEISTIMQALAPGVALTSMIFYYGNLQSRMIFTVETIRSLNREARQLQAGDPADGESRIESIRWQVEFLSRRFRNIHHAMLLVYGGFGSFIVTIVALLAAGVFFVPALNALAIFTFTLGFVCMGAATLISSQELRLAQMTIMEDIGSSYSGSGDSRPLTPGRWLMLHKS